LSLPTVCPHCHFRFRVNDRLALRRIACLRCNEAFTATAYTSPEGELASLHPTDLLGRLKAAEVSLSFEGGKMHVHAQRGALTTEMKVAIHYHRRALRRLIHGETLNEAEARYAAEWIEECLSKPVPQPPPRAPEKPHAATARAECERTIPQPVVPPPPPPPDAARPVMPPEANTITRPVPAPVTTAPAKNRLPAKGGAISYEERQRRIRNQNVFLAWALVIGGMLWIGYHVQLKNEMRDYPRPPETTYRQTGPGGQQWDVTVRKTPVVPGR
jgi:hypothetical protein